MATSGTYTFNPTVGSLIQQAFRRCGVARTDLSPDHMLDAIQEANLLLVDWANGGPQLWTVELETTTLVEGTATYNVDAETVDILDAWISTPNGDGTYTDRQLTSISRTEYASYPNKSIEAPPSSYWFNRAVVPTITLYPVPNDDTVLLKYYRFRRQQDVGVAGGQTADLQYRWLNAFVSGLAYRLSVIYAPDRAPPLKAVADEAFFLASAQDTEKSFTYISPMLGGYYR